MKPEELRGIYALYKEDPGLALLEMNRLMVEKVSSLNEKNYEFKGASLIKGEQGEAGRDGKDGKPGKNGRDGKDGKPGKDGKDGAPGKQGARGPAGPRGLQGKPGKDGKDGKPGKDGKDGASFEPTEDFFDQVARGLEALKGNRALDYFALRNRPGVKAYSEGRTIHRGGGGSVTLSYDLSSQCDGNTKTFVIPTNSRVLAVFGTQFPVIYSQNDYSYTTTSLTLGDSVGAPETGQTLTILYVE